MPPKRPKPDGETNEVGGAGRDRTDDLLLAKQALSQLSYGPALKFFASVIVAAQRVFWKGCADGEQFYNASAAFLILQSIKKYNVK